MNDEIQSRLMKYLDHIETAVQDGGDLAKEEIPKFANELVSWMFWDATVTACVTMLICMIIVTTVFKTWKWANKHYKENPRNDWAFAVFAGVSFMSVTIGIPTLVESIGETRQAIKCAVAPRVVLVQELHKLIK